jgi:hypothetical protein
VVFSSIAFLFYFLPAFLVAHSAAPGTALKNVLLLLASLFFYAWGEPWFVLVLAGQIVVNYGAALAIDASDGPYLRSLQAGRGHPRPDRAADVLPVTVNRAATSSRRRAAPRR